MTLTWGDQADAQLVDMAKRRQAGGQIDADLKEKGLSLAAFAYLMRIRDLAATGTVLDGEWHDVYSILVQAQKSGKFAAWRAEEQQGNVTLGPTFFQTSADATAPTLLAFSTGVDALGVTLGDEAVDPHWTIFEG